MLGKGIIAVMRLGVWVVWTVLLCAAAVPTYGDIYRYVDDRGTMHFSNVPISPEYDLYIREAPAGRPYEVPSDYDPFIAEAARQYDVPFSLIKAVIKVESDFEPSAVSHVGARGLMQIMPETGRDLGLTDAFDPRENIFAGVRYLKELLTRFRGDLPLVLAAYNAGPDRVDALGRVPRIRETERFVRKVMEHLGGD